LALPESRPTTRPRFATIAGGKRRIGRQGADLVARPDECRDFVAERGFQPLLYLPLESRHGLCPRRKQDVAAGDERLDFRKPQRLELVAQHVHLHHVAADVDGAQKGDVAGHGGRSYQSVDL
jgi:hypothetical protein